MYVPTLKNDRGNLINELPSCLFGNLYPRKGKVPFVTLRSLLLIILYNGNLTMNSYIFI